MPRYDDFMDIATILDDYSKDIYKEMQVASIQVADKGKKKLQEIAPKRTGKYRRGFRVKSTSNLYSFSSTIYNATNWQLTHLLEKGHVTRNGGRTKAIKHFEPVEKECNDEFYQDVVNIIERGV